MSRERDSFSSWWIKGNIDINDNTQPPESTRNIRRHFFICWITLPADLKTDLPPKLPYVGAHFGRWALLFYIMHADFHKLVYDQLTCHKEIKRYWWRSTYAIMFV